MTQAPGITGTPASNRGPVFNRGSGSNRGYGSNRGSGCNRGPGYNRGVTGASSPAGGPCNLCAGAPAPAGGSKSASVLTLVVPVLPPRCNGPHWRGALPRCVHILQIGQVHLLQRGEKG